MCQVGEAAQLRRYLPRSTRCRGGTDLSGWRGCPTPAVSPRSTRCRGGTDLSGWRGCPTPAVSPRSSRCRGGTDVSGWRGCPTPAVSPPLNSFAVEGTDLSRLESPAQLRWYLPEQVVVFEFQLCNVPVVVGGDAPPVAQGSVSQPVGAVPPVQTIRCIVEGNQGFPVRFGGAGGRGRTAVRSRRFQAQRRQWARPLSLWWKASVRGRPASPWGWTRSGRRLSRRTARQSRRPRAPP